MILRRRRLILNDSLCFADVRVALNEYRVKDSVLGRPLFVPYQNQTIRWKTHVHFFWNSFSFVEFFLPPHETTHKTSRGLNHFCPDCRCNVKNDPNLLFKFFAIWARFVLGLLASKKCSLCAQLLWCFSPTGPPTVGRTAQEWTTSISCATLTTAPSTSKISVPSSASSATPTLSSKMPNTTGCPTSIPTVSQKNVNRLFYSSVWLWGVLSQKRTVNVGEGRRSEEMCCVFKTGMFPTVLDCVNILATL